MAHKVPTRRDYRVFGLALAALFAAAGLLPLLRGHPVRWWAVAVAAAVALAALAAPGLLRPVYRLSLKVGGVLGWINTRILLGLLFYGVFAPVGLVRRVSSGAGTWARRKQAPSYWHARGKADPAAQMRHQF